MKKKNIIYKFNDKILVEDINIIATVHNIKNDKIPYYELKYKPVGNNEYCIGYGSYDLYKVCRWLEMYFILVETIYETR